MLNPHHPLVPLPFSAHTYIYPTMKAPFHPYQRSATRSTLRNKKDPEDDDLYLLETATTTAQALPTPNFSKRRSSANASAIIPVSSKQAPPIESLVDRIQETEKPIFPVPDVIDPQKPGGRSAAPISPNDSDPISLQSSPSHHRQPRRSRTSATYMVTGLGEAGSSNPQPQIAGPSYRTPLHVPYGAHCSSPQKLPDGNDLIQTVHVLPRCLPPVNPSPYAPVGAMIAVRKANYVKQQWNMSSPGIVIGHNFTDYFVGKKLFSYVVVLGTPVGDIVSNFAPYYGEVGTLNAGQAAFPPVLHKDVVQRKEALYTVYARVFLHPKITPHMIWQKARIISRPNETPTQVRLLYGDLANRIFSATDLLPYTQESYAAIARGDDAWKTVAIPSQIL